MATEIWVADRPASVAAVECVLDALIRKPDFQGALAPGYLWLTETALIRSRYCLILNGRVVPPNSVEPSVKPAGLRGYAPKLNLSLCITPRPSTPNTRLYVMTKSKTLYNVGLVVRDRRSKSTPWYLKVLGGAGISMEESPTSPQWLEAAQQIIASDMLGQSQSVRPSRSVKPVITINHLAHFNARSDVPAVVKGLVMAVEENCRPNDPAIKNLHATLRVHSANIAVLFRRFERHMRTDPQYRDAMYKEADYLTFEEFFKAVAKGGDGFEVGYTYAVGVIDVLALVSVPDDTQRLSYHPEPADKRKTASKLAEVLLHLLAETSELEEEPSFLDRVRDV